MGFFTERANQGQPKQGTTPTPTTPIETGAAVGKAVSTPQTTGGFFSQRAKAYDTFQQPTQPAPQVAVEQAPTPTPPQPKSWWEDTVDTASYIGKRLTQGIGSSIQRLRTTGAGTALDIVPIEAVSKENVKLRTDKEIKNIDTQLKFNKKIEKGYLQQFSESTGIPTELGVSESIWNLVEPVTNYSLRKRIEDTKNEIKINEEQQKKAFNEQNRKLLESSLETKRNQLKDFEERLRRNEADDISIDYEKKVKEGRDLTAEERKDLEKLRQDLVNTKKRIEEEEIKNPSFARKLKNEGIDIRNETLRQRNELKAQYGNPDDWSVKGFLGNTADSAASMVGNLVTTAAVTLATKNPTLGVRVGLGSTFADVSTSSYEEAIAEGASEKDAKTKMNLDGLFSVMINGINLDRFAKKISEPQKQAIKEGVFKKLKNWSLDKAVGGGFEGGTEVLEEIFANATSSLYKENPDLFQGTGEAFSQAFVLGTIVEGLTGIKLKKNKISQQAEISAGKIIEEAYNTPEDQRTQIQKDIIRINEIENPQDSETQVAPTPVAPTVQEGFITPPEIQPITAPTVEPTPTPEPQPTITPEDTENERQAFKSAVFELSNAIPKDQLKNEARLNFTAFNLPESEFETLYNETIQEIEAQPQIEQRQMAEMTADQNPFISDPTISQFVPTIRKALRVYDLNKRKGIDDIATISNKVSGFDGALEALTNYYGDKAQDMDFVSKLYSNYLRDKDLLAQIKKETKKKLGAKKKAVKPAVAPETKPELKTEVKEKPTKKPTKKLGAKKETISTRVKFLTEQARKKFTTLASTQKLLNESIGAMNGLISVLGKRNKQLLDQYPDILSKNFDLKAQAVLKAAEEYGITEEIDNDYYDLKRIVEVIGKKRDAGSKGAKQEFTPMEFNIDDFDDTIDMEDEVEVVDKQKQLYDSFEQAEKDLEEKLGDSERYSKSVDLPELVQIVRDLTNSPIEVREKITRSNALGVFKGSKGIALRSDIFKYPHLARKILSHEIGHLVDWLPDYVSKRGNVVARIATLRDFTRNLFTDPVVNAQIENLLVELRDIQSQRRALKENKKVPERNKSKDLELARRVREINKEVNKLQENAINNKEISNELKQWTYYWSNVNPAQASKKYLTYLHSSEELYADAISGLLTSPLKFREVAPKFVESFFANLDTKPEVKLAYDSIQQKINDNEIYTARNETIDNSFKKGEDFYTAKAVEARQMANDLWFMLKTLFVRKETALIDFENKNKIAPDERASVVMGDLAYSDGYIKNRVLETFSPVYDTLKEVDNGWNDLGKVLMLERIINERKEIANPFGFTPENAPKQLEETLNARSDEDRVKIERALLQFRAAQEVFLGLYEEAGIYSDELLRQMKGNTSYATFQVLDYIEENITPEIYAQEGTLKDIANPATATIMKNISILLSIERNNANKAIANQVKTIDPKNAQDAEVVYNPDLKRQIVKEPKDKKLGLIKWRENGQWKGVYVDKYIADVTKNMSNQTLKQLETASKIITTAPLYRNLFIVYNLQFQSFNLVRDFLRLWKAVPSSNFWEAMKQFGVVANAYKGSIGSAWARARDEFDPIIREMEDKKILGLTYNDIIKGGLEEDTQIERTFRKVGISKGEPVRLGMEKTVYDFTRRQKQLAQVYDALIKLKDGFQILGDFLESLPKVAGYKILKDSGMGDAELREFVRTRVGSPAYRYKGTATGITNNLFLFSNSIIQSTVADIKTATEPSTRSGFWYKTLIADIMPQIIKKAILAGLLGEALKELYSKIGNYDLSNYNIIPIGIDENGKAQYMRIPRDPSGQIIGNITWTLLNAPENGIGGDDLLKIFSIGGDITPDMSPNFKVIGNFMQYAAGRNPYDDFRGRYMIPDKEWKARNETPDAFNILLTESARDMGLGIILPSNNDWQSESTLTGVQKFLNTFGINKTLGAFIKVSNLGEVEQNRKIKEKVEGKRAAQTLADDKKIDEAVKKYQSSTDKSAENNAKIENELKIAVFGNEKRTITKEEQNRMKNIITKYRTALIRGKSDAKINAFIDANTNEEKAYLLIKYSESMPYEEFMKFQEELKYFKLITKDVSNKANRIKSGQ